MRVGVVRVFVGGDMWEGGHVKCEGDVGLPDSVCKGSL